MLHSERFVAFAKCIGVIPRRSNGRFLVVTVRTKCRILSDQMTGGRTFETFMLFALKSASKYWVSGSSPVEATKLTL